MNLTFDGLVAATAVIPFRYTNQVWSMTLPSQVRPFIWSYGQALQFNPGDPAGEAVAVAQLRHLAKTIRTPQLFWPRPANARYPTGRFQVTEFPEVPSQDEWSVWRGPESQDGVILRRPGQAIAWATSDCPTVVIWSVRGGPVAVLHCARDALHGVDLSDPDPERSVIYNAFALCGKDWERSEYLRVAITLGIGGQYFVHNPRGESPGPWSSTMQILVDAYGRDILINQKLEALDLRTLMLRQLARYCINTEQVYVDDLETSSDQRLASYRRWMMADQPGVREHNLVVVRYPW